METKKPVIAINMLTLLIEDAKNFNVNKDKRHQFIEILFFHKVNCNKDTCPCCKYMNVIHEVSYKNFERDNIYNDEKTISLNKKLEVIITVI